MNKSVLKIIAILTLFVVACSSNSDKKDEVQFESANSFNATTTSYSSFIEPKESTNFEAYAKMATNIYSEAKLIKETAKDIEEETIKHQFFLSFGFDDDKNHTSITCLFYFMGKETNIVYITFSGRNKVYSYDDIDSNNLDNALLMHSEYMNTHLSNNA